LEANDETRVEPTESLRPETPGVREPRTDARRLDMGFVSLVGAGPGDPDLLTLRAARALAAADIVFYDALVARKTLDLAPRAQRFSVGKRAGRPSMEQEAINRLLVRSARRGKRVVRLKGGDPFVFGRGGEEALALAAAGVPFEVIPGVSNAVGAPALSGIPVTHRGLASAFAVVSGHAESAWRPVVEGLAPGTATLVVLMGLSTREALAAALQARGWAASTPAAILWAAGTPSATRWVGTLGSLAHAEAPFGAEGAPGTIVVGAVVALSATIGRRDREGTEQDVRPAASPAAAEGGHHARPR
jgi:uroporphyrin-III C-methyltransferase/precorrin-2 dehydrogenase/sirohydrochlorin ferrochelatase